MSAHFHLLTLLWRNWELISSEIEPVEERWLFTGGSLLNLQKLKQVFGFEKSVRSSSYNFSSSNKCLKESTFNKIWDKLNRGITGATKRTCIRSSQYRTFSLVDSSAEMWSVSLQRARARSNGYFYVLWFFANWQITLLLKQWSLSASRWTIIWKNSNIAKTFPQKTVSQLNFREILLKQNPPILVFSPE